MLLCHVVAVSAAVGATRARSEKTRLIADALRVAHDVTADDVAGPDAASGRPYADAAARDVAIVTSYLSGTLPQRRTGVGWRSLTDPPEPAAEPRLTVAETDAALSAIAGYAGSGSAAARAAAVRGLLGRATSAEQAWLRDLLTGQTRQGALDGIMLAAIARAAAVPEAAVRRAVMLAGHAAPVAVAALAGGEPALAAIGLEVGRPLRPMLAGSAPGLESLFTDPSGGPDDNDPPATAAVPIVPVAVECKLDGIRLQAHKDGSEVSLYTRTLEDVTARLPEIVEVVAALPAETAVLDGEAIALAPSGRPEPFQVTGARLAGRTSVDTLRAQVPLTAYLFDLLHLDGVDLLDEPASVRYDALARLAPELLAPRVVTADRAVAAAFFADVVGRGHEGVVVKRLDAPYAAGRRGSAWTKVKPRHTLDLVVLAVEWGSGRRRGYLSNIHLGARDPSSGGFVMLGKTFKGMTDEMLAWQTRRFLELETSRSSYVVQLRPEQVVEIAFDGIQTSSRYPGGMALRFARVIRYRDDKTAAEADTIDTVRALRLSGGR